MDYVIFESGGKQYKASKGSTLLVDKLSALKDSEIVLDKVVLQVAGEGVQVGMPYVKGVAVKAKVLGDIKGEKVNILQFKAKSNYRRRVGFRKTMSKIEISDILLEGITVKKEKSTVVKKSKIEPSSS